jgi:hypothetical protein
MSQTETGLVLTGTSLLEHQLTGNRRNGTATGCRIAIRRPMALFALLETVTGRYLDSVRRSVARATRPRWDLLRGLSIIALLAAPDVGAMKTNSRQSSPNSLARTIVPANRSTAARSIPGGVVQKAGDRLDRDLQLRFADITSICDKAKSVPGQLRASPRSCPLLQPRSAD